MTMVEKVALAIGGLDNDRCNPCTDKKIRKCEDCLNAARAAIAAMREPTTEMTGCNEEVHWGYSCHVCGGLKEGWQFMIDAALAP